MRFEPNLGQTDPRVRYLGRARGFLLFLTDAEAVFSLGGPGGPEHARRRFGNARGNPRPAPGGVLRMAFEGAAAAPRFEPAGALGWRTNYFLGDDPSRWRTGVPGYGAVALRGLWPGVDLVLRGDPSRLEYDLVAAPGADLGAVRFRLSGHSALRIDDRGDLVVGMPAGEVRHGAPVLWQEGPGGRRPVAGGFRLTGEDSFGFEAGPLDASLPLVVDPKVDFATYLGGSSSDWVTDVSVDSSGNVLVAGMTQSTNFPTAAPYQASYAGGSGNFPDDAFVTKYNASLTGVVFSTYLGGSGFDDCYGVAADPSGNVILCGITNSTNFPTSSPYQGSNAGGWDDMYVVKMSPSGSTLSFSTYLGTSGYDEANDVAADSSGVYVVGATSSSAFPQASSAQSTYGGGSWDAVLLKFNSSGSALTFSSYHGGSGLDYGFGVAVDSSGAMYAVGMTNSTNMPTKGPFQATYGGGSGNVPNDAFAVKATPGGGSLTWSTYFGGSGYDDCYQCAVSSGGDLLLAGFTSSTNLPTASAYQSSNAGGDDAYVARIASGGSTLVFATYLGGTGADQTYGIGLDSSGAVTACGLTNSSDFPTWNAFQKTYIGGGSPFPDDAWVAKFDGSGSPLRYSTYLASAGFDDPGGMAVDGNGNAIVAGITSTNQYPLLNPLQSGFGGGAYDTYVVRIVLSLPAAPTALDATSAGSGTVLLNWSDNSVDETGFEIERRSGSDGFSRVATAAAGSFSWTDYAVAPSTTYAYRVRAVNGDGASDWTNEDSATTGAVVPAPGTPQDLVATALSPGSASLSWSDRSDNEITFEVQRRPRGGAFALVASLAAGTTAWTDEGLQPDASYGWRVRAVGSSGVSFYSAEATASTFPTLEVAVARGLVSDSPKPGKDRVRASGTFSFLGDSPDGAADPLAESMVASLVLEDRPILVSVAAGDPGWKVKGTRLTWKSPRDYPAKLTLVLDMEKRTFAVSASRIDLAAAPANPVRVSLRLGNDGGSSRVDWTPRKPGLLKFP